MKKSTQNYLNITNLAEMLYQSFYIDKFFCFFFQLAIICLKVWKVGIQIISTEAEEFRKQTHAIKWVSTAHYVKSL